MGINLFESPMGTQYIAFLRAINVGGHIVKMAELKKVFEAARLDDVATFIASGNVIFSSRARDAAKLEQQIEAAIGKALGYTVSTILRTTDQVAAVAQFPAFTAEQRGAASLYVGLLQTEPTADAIKKVVAMRTEIDDLRVHGREVYWLARQNVQKSTISGAAVEKALKTPTTFRNINTVRRLAAKYAIA